MTSAERIRVRGLVQGVGFRPNVWRLAREQGLDGWVCNDAEGVLIEVWGEATALANFVLLLEQQCPPLARIDQLQRTPLDAQPTESGFHIRASHGGEVHTAVVADAATCATCAAEIVDPANRRYRYPFTNCTHCGPRLSIVRSIPYDRVNTSMAAFPMCAECRAEYQDPSDRRFHAQPNACPSCGPRAWLEPGLRSPEVKAGEDALATASRLLAEGWILAIKGIGGFHLACDAGNDAAVERLRQRKRRFAKPFALMARDLEVMRRYAHCSAAEQALLQSAAAPLVLLEVSGPERVAAQVAPGQNTLGFMLPYSPLHQLLLADWTRPLVMTSGNLSEEPQCIDNLDASRRLSGLADALLLHDRAIVNRLDDSVVRLMAARPRPLRRARGYAPTPIRLPQGFEHAPDVLAMGGELKNSFCLLKDGQAILSQHLGDLQEVNTAEEYGRTLGLYLQLYQHSPERVAVDMHPDYLASRQGELLAAERGLDLVRVQHHFAHIASVLAEQGRPLDAPPVLGIALDGLGYGADGTLWGGEFLLADYRGYRRLAHLKATPLPGGHKAMREPWRNTYAHLLQHLGWPLFVERYGHGELAMWLQRQPLHLLETLLQRGIHSPLSSSCGRWFDAVAGALDLCRAGISYEGEAAIALEVLANQAGTAEQGYPFRIEQDSAVSAWQLDPAPMWQALLEDLHRGEPRQIIAARFHRGLAEALADLACRLASRHGLDSVALSGGVLQNKNLFEALASRLQQSGLHLLAHEQVPTNDGGLSLGQAVIAAAQALQEARQ